MAADECAPQRAARLPSLRLRRSPSPLLLDHRSQRRVAHNACRDSLAAISVYYVHLVEEQILLKKLTDSSTFFCSNRR